MMLRLDRLQVRAPDNVVCFSQCDAGASFTWRHENMDGSVHEFALVVVSLPNGRLAVREEVPGTKLPRTCLESHINGDGTFCMFLPGATDEPRTEEQWWTTLSGYIDLQLRADALGDWPDRFGRAHGHLAYLQLAFEEAARATPVAVVKFCRAQPLSAVQGTRIDGRRRPCPCGSGKRIKDCHETEMVDLTSILRVWQACQDMDSTTRHGGKCCGRFEKCPLRAAAKRLEVQPDAMASNTT